MKILFVDHAGEPGGGQLGLLRYLASATRTFEVSCLFLTGGSVSDRISAMGVRSHVGDTTEFAMRRLPAYVRWLRASLRDAEADLVVVNSLYAALAISFTGRRMPLVYYSRVSFDSLRGWKRLLTERWIFPRFSGFLANSEWTAACLPATVRDRPVGVAHPVSGLTAEVFDRVPSPILEGDILRLVSLSRPDRWKGIDLIIKAADELAGARGHLRVVVDIYGGGFYADPAYGRELEQLADYSAAEINFKGHVDDVWPVLEEHDVVILGTRQPEPFGQVVAQGLAAGRLVVVSDAGGPLEMINDGLTGLTYRMGDASSLAAALSRAVEDPVEARKIAQRGRVAVQRFSDDGTVAEFEAVISAMALDLHDAGTRRGILKCPS